MSNTRHDFWHGFEWVVGVAVVLAASALVLVLVMTYVRFTQ
jgi:LPS O-antigen subunit length determinant protein (WzzB/FepE family)